MPENNPYAEAIEALHNRGWYQGHYFQPGVTNPGLCLIGALREVAAARFGHHYPYMPCENRNSILDYSTQWAPLLQDVLEEQYGYRDLAAFNDFSTRTQTEVEALLEKAAVRWDETRP